MGTNYYWRDEPCLAPCKHCNGFDMLHIGKSYAAGKPGLGWIFEGHFRGDQPWLCSAETWWEHLGAAGGAIFDEYNKVYSAEEFIQKVETVSTVGRRKQFDLVAEQHPSRRARKAERGFYWLDKEGFTFCGGEFS